MPRPKKCRYVENFPQITSFKPSGVVLPDLEPTILGYEELEAIRLADYQAKKHEEAANIMNISRATFGRIIENARYIVADALLNGKAIVIQGGEFCCRDYSDKANNMKLMTIMKEKHKKCLNCSKYINVQNITRDSENVNIQEEVVYEK
jgi:predicted DNA-binding protein (UPF0251 family)